MAPCPRALPLVFGFAGTPLPPCSTRPGTSAGTVVLTAAALFQAFLTHFQSRQFRVELLEVLVVSVQLLEAISGLFALTAVRLDPVAFEFHTPTRLLHQKVRQSFLHDVRRPNRQANPFHFFSLIAHLSLHIE